MADYAHLSNVGHHPGDPYLLPALILDIWGLLLAVIRLQDAIRDPPSPRKGAVPNPIVAVVLGFALVAVPTVFTVFPSTVKSQLGIRVFVVGAWTELIVTALSLTAWSEFRRYVEERDARRRSEARRDLASAFQRVLEPGFGGIPAHFTFTVYAPDPSGSFLYPLYPRALTFEDPTIFAVGSGATGVAWQEDGVVPVVGSSVANAEYRLSSEQERYFSRFQSVAACVIHNAAGDRLGVLSAISREPDETFRAQEGAKLLQAAADTLGWIMPEAVRWLMPAPEELGR